ncbi:MAG: glycosyltransferase [Gemmatimonadota bacterium]
MQYSFLLVNYNMAGLVTNLIANLASEIPPGATFELLIADNSSDATKALPNTGEIVGVPATILRIDNRGYVDALNRLIPLAQGELIMISHPDIELAPGALVALDTFLRTHPQAGVVSPDLRYPDGSPCRIRLQFPDLRTEVRRVMNILAAITTGRRPFRGEHFWDRHADEEVETVMAVCMLFRREALQSVAKVDPNLVFYYSNDYLCGTLRRHGWTCHYTLSALAIHFERFAPRHLYSESAEMAYKRSPIAANPRMREDFFIFLSSFYGFGTRLAIRACALAEDSIQLLAQFKRPRERREEIQRLWQSVRVDLGIG